MNKSMLQAIKHTRGKVKAILEEYPETRNCDKLLCIMYWKLVDGVKDLDDIQFATSPEVIRRTRQWFNEQGMYLATDPEVLKRRRQKAMEMRAGIAKI
jgi:hypothetical protein